MWIGQKIRSMKSVYPPLFSRESPLFIEIQLFEQKEFLRKENKTELFQYIRLFIMVLHQYQYLLWYCNFAVHTPSSSYTFSVTAVLITAMNIKQTFKELQNCTARQSWSFSHLLNLHGCDEFAINFLHSWVFRWICLIAGDVASSESFDRNNFGGTWLVGKGHCLPAESKSAASEQRSDSKDVNNCIELSTGKCILIFNDDFALCTGPEWAQAGMTALSDPDNEWNLIFCLACDWPEVGARPGWPEVHCCDGPNLAKGLPGWPEVAWKTGLAWPWGQAR